MSNVSIEALEDLAERIRAVHIARERAVMSSEPEPPAVAPDSSRLSSAYGLAIGTDRSLAVLFAEAIALDTRARAVRSYEAAWLKNPIDLPEKIAIPWRTLWSQIVFEPNEHRRAALAHAGESRAKDLLPVARSMVDDWREAANKLGLQQPALLHEALGLGEAGDVEFACESVLDATEEIYRELENWMRARVGLKRTGELSWEDRLRMLSSPRATELIPLGDRGGIASRWIARVGLESPLARVRDETRLPNIAATGARALADRAGDRAMIVGTAAPNALGAMELSGALFEAIAWIIPDEDRAGPRLGVDRIHHALAETLGARLFLEPAFLAREASVDRGAREPVLLEILYSELFALRSNAALARFCIAVLSHEGNLPARMREGMFRATGSSPAPTWAAHIGARAFELRPGARVLASVLEPRWNEQLRDLHDQDWFRNPRAGETLRSHLNGMRKTGTLAWFAGSGERRDVLKADALARKTAEALRVARL